MYDVATFTKPVPMNPERSGEYAQGEEQNLEFFRYARNMTPVAELIREKLAPPLISSDQGRAEGAG